MTNWCFFNLNIFCWCSSSNYWCSNYWCSKCWWGCKIIKAIVSTWRIMQEVYNSLRFWFFNRSFLNKLENGIKYCWFWRRKVTWRF
jgi:hypothetical protein